MNYKLVFHITGRVLLLEAAAMALALIVALLYGEPASPFLYAIGLCAAFGGLLSLLPYKRNFFAREGFFAVGLIWVVMGFFGSLPFYFSGCFDSFVDCLFECYSGFTTTGATILTDIGALPRGIHFWRAFTHWLGGMGVLVLTSALLPSMGIRSHFLIKAESPGPVFSKLTPRQSQSSKVLYILYIILSLLQLLCLKLSGMSLYDSLIHTFSTAGTGGFSNYSASVAAFDSPAIEMIIAVFMLLFSLNFAAYFLMLCGRLRNALQSDELRFFLCVVALATLAISINILPSYQSAWAAFRYAFFQVASIISTTGFATADYMLWPVFSQVIIMLLLICGACAGSTGGGLKCSRVLLNLRSLLREIRLVIHPRSVRVIKLDGRVVGEDTLHSISVYTVCYALIVLFTTLVISLDNFDFATSVSAAMTCLSNVGPGLNLVGPAGNFAGFSSMSKLVLAGCMVIGRLEFFPILVLLSRRAWLRT